MVSQSNRVIPIIPTQNNKTLYGKPKEGITATTRILKVDHLSKKQIVYAKLYRHKHELLYEIIGYLLAHHLNLPQPKGFILLLSPQQQTELFGIVNPTTTQYPVWATTRIDGESATYKYKHCSQALKKDLQKWFNLYGAIAFDDLVGNIDRNLGNLIRESSGQYQLIDHGNIFGGHSSRSKHLCPHEETRNVLYEYCLTQPKSHQSQQRKDHRIRIAEHIARHSQAFEESKEELYFWWSKLAKGQERKLYNYLHTRSHIDTHIVKKKYNLLAV
nr:hypothetical protein 11 [Piscirickettsiaceae bacterium]